MMFIFFCLFMAKLGFTQTNRVKTTRNEKYLFGSESYPGAKKNEVFLLSISTDGCDLYFDGIIHPYYTRGEKINYFNTITWESKRLGTVAYDTTGVVLTGFRPVFVNIKEYLRITQTILIKM